MRWSNLLEEEDERARLPGYRDEAVVRHFEAPGGIQTRFYEVRAKSILNRVPEASRMPFRWTINAYRGCTHACSFCQWGGTPILMADGRHKALELLELGDEIYGTDRCGGKYRKYVRTVVLDKWITIKPAYRVVLEDGTELITSGDHRFLSNRGWKHVLNSARSEPDRPHLTTRNWLVGTGAFAPQPVETGEYRRGYLCGILRGDGHIGSRLVRASGTAHGDVAPVPARAHRPRGARGARDPTSQQEEIETTEWVFRRRSARTERWSRSARARERSLSVRADLVEWPAARDR